MSKVASEFAPSTNEINERAYRMPCGWYCNTHPKQKNRAVAGHIVIGTTGTCAVFDSLHETSRAANDANWALASPLSDAEYQGLPTFQAHTQADNLIANLMDSVHLALVGRIPRPISAILAQPYIAGPESRLGIALGHTGACRAYLLRNGRAACLTLDHSEAYFGIARPWAKQEQYDELTDLTKVSRTEGLDFLQRRYLYTGLGHASFRYSIAHYSAQLDDRFILCTDRVPTILTFRQIEAKLIEGSHLAPAQAAQSLVGAAQAHAIMARNDRINYEPAGAAGVFIFDVRDTP